MLLSIYVVQKHWPHFVIRVQKFFLIGSWTAKSWCDLWLIYARSISSNPTVINDLSLECFYALSVHGNSERKLKSQLLSATNELIFFAAETLLKPHGDEGRLHDLIPAGCIAKSFTRDSRGGGLAVVYNKCLSKRISITATFSFHHQSFEVMRL